MTPEKDSPQWRRNESIIAKNPVLRAARDTSEGFTRSSTISTTQQTVTDAYREGWQRIFGAKDDS